MAHPYSHEAQASQKRRLKALGATAGKSHGSSNMYKKGSLPKKGAGTQREYTISGGTSRKRADRMAAGGTVGRKRRPHATTNIIISHAGGQGGTGAGGGGATARPAPPMPVPVPRPVPVPAGAAPAGPGPVGPAPVAPRPAIAAVGPPPVAAGAVPRPPIAAGPPPGAAPMRPPGMKTGGTVKKAAKGGFLREPSKGKAYPGFPHSPTTKTSSAVSAHKAGGRVGRRANGGDTDTGDEAAGGYAGGGKVAKRAVGGPAGPGGGGGGFSDPAVAAVTSALAPVAPGAGLAGAMMGGGGQMAPGPILASGPNAGTSGAFAPTGGGMDDPTGAKQRADFARASGDGGGLDTDTNVTIGRRSLSPLGPLPGGGGRLLGEESERKRSGGGVKKRQFGGGGMGSSFGGGQATPAPQSGGLLGPGPGRAPTPAIQGPPTISGRPARPAMPLTVPQPPTLGARLQRPAPGMTVGYKKGGGVKKYRDWGKGQTTTSGGSMSPRLSNSEKYHQQGKGYADGGSVMAGGGSGVKRLARSGKKLPAKTEA